MDVLWLLSVTRNFVQRNKPIYLGGLWDAKANDKGTLKPRPGMAHPGS